MIRTIPSIVDGTAVYTKQPEESPTPYAAMISKKMGLMDFSKSAVELERLVRGLNPWPSAYTFLNGRCGNVQLSVQNVEKKHRERSLVWINPAFMLHAEVMH